MRIALLHAFGAEAGGAEAHVGNLRDLLMARGHDTLVVDVPRERTVPRRRFHQTLLDRIDAFDPGLVHVHNLNRGDSRIVDMVAAGGRTVVRTLHDHSLVCPAGSLYVRGRPCERCLSGGFLHAGLNGCINVPEAIGLSASQVLGRQRFSSAISRFLVPSRALAATLRRGGAVAPIDYVGTFVPGRSFLPGRAGEDRTVVFAGRLVAGKGLDTLLSAARGLDARIVVLGTGPLVDSAAARVRSEGLSNVHLLGRLTGADYLDQLTRAALVVVPSEAAEVAPTVACEAFAAGIPVIASAVGGLPELVGCDERGILVPPGDPVALGRAIDELLRDHERRRALGLAARDYARDQLSADGYYTRLSAIYADLSVELRAHA